MSADRARLTYTAARKYREVISQQGRVTLEADQNESVRLSSETVRQHALDFVGPWGTPDDGYKCGIAGNDLIVGPGTMFVGGNRVTAEQPIVYSSQSEWLDRALPQPWTQEPFRPINTIATKQHIVLVLREQEIGAEEDPALREVALGGPDTAARTRLLQRVMLVDTAAETCAEASKSTTDHFASIGLEHNQQTAALEPYARLKVGLVTGSAPTTACDPPAASGYLGADNQLIRIQLVAYDPATRRGTLLWSYNNASSLFRGRAVEANLVELERQPISEEHRPRAGQVVQVLLPAADLGEGALASALTGHYAKLTAPYQAETRRVPLPANLPTILQAPQAPLLFLRLWEDQVDFQIGTAVELAGTGLEVTISSTSGSSLHVGDYWSIAARPQTPNAVYPERYRSAPQPPDGPRMWACPLAVAASGGEFKDCRLPFDNLPELTARQPGGGDCCCITVRPEDAGRLQEIIDTAAGNGTKVTISFEPGEYKLPRPLYFTEKHDGLTLAACSNTKPVLMADDPNNEEFAYGLMILAAVKDVSIEGLALLVRPTPIPEDMRSLMKQAHYSGSAPGEWLPESFGIGFRLLHCVSVEFERCSLKLEQATNVFAVGILVQGRNGKVAISGCRFSSGARRIEDAVTVGAALAPLLLDEHGAIQTSSAEVFTVEASEFALVTSAIHLSGDVLLSSIRNNQTRAVHNSLAVLAYRQVGNAATVWQHMEQLANEAHHIGNGEILLFHSAFIGGRTSLMRVLPIAMLLDARKLVDSMVTRPISYSLGDMAVDELPNEGAPWNDVQRFTVDGNRFGSYPVFGEPSWEGPDTLVWDVMPTKFTEYGNSDLTVTGNNMATYSFSATLMVVMCRAFNITGNVVSNYAPKGTYDNGSSDGWQPYSLVAQPNMRPMYGELFCSMLTVTGNTFYAMTNLHHIRRQEWENSSVPVELRNWHFFNTTYAG